MTRSRDRSSNGSEEIRLPGLRRLRAAVASLAGAKLPKRSALVGDTTAGLTVTVSMVPDGMANGLLAGVNPIYGLYANVIGPLVGGALVSSRLMVINNTSATALVAGQALESDDGAGPLFLMVMLAGLFALGAGLARLGRLTRFVSFSVMAGFITGIAVVLIASQLPTITGVSVNDGNTITQSIELIGNLADTHLPSLGLALLTILLVVALPRLGLTRGGSLIAIAVPSLIVALGAVDGVALVQDVGEIPEGLPLPDLPSLSDFSPDVLAAALAVAVIALVQGAGVSQSVPNPDGAPRDPSRDFIAQGAANVAVSAFQGLPVGGSLSGTAINVTSSARGRWAGIASGLWMGLIVIAFPGVISREVMPGLGALLVIAGVSIVDPSDLRSVWRGGWASRITAATTFLATLFLPIQFAVAVGVLLAALLYLNRSSTHITLVELVKRPDGRVEERDAPDRLPDNQITVLDVYGDLFFAGARTFDQRLPDARDSRDPVVVLRLRGRAQLGATAVEVLSKYARDIGEAGGRLYLTGLGGDARKHLERTTEFSAGGPGRAYEATSIVGESTEDAYADAEEWLHQRGDENGSDGDDR